MSLFLANSEGRCRLCPTRAEATLGTYTTGTPTNTAASGQLGRRELAEWKGGPKTPHRSHLRSLTEKEGKRDLRYGIFTLRYAPARDCTRDTQKETLLPPLLLSRAPCGPCVVIAPLCALVNSPRRISSAMLFCEDTRSIQGDIHLDAAESQKSDMMALVAPSELRVL